MRARFLTGRSFGSKKLTRWKAPPHDVHISIEVQRESVGCEGRRWK